jgi:hypothetical protein
MDQTPDTIIVDVHEAARRLSMTEDGVRKRIKRGQLIGWRDTSGRREWRVQLPADASEQTDETDTPQTGWQTAVPDGQEVTADRVLASAGQQIGPEVWMALLAARIDQNVQARLDEQSEEIRRLREQVAALSCRLPEPQTVAPAPTLRAPWWRFWRS